MASRLLRTLAHTIMLTVVAASAAPADPATPYVGVWALQLASCGAGPGDAGAPMQIAAEYYDDRDTHCDFVAVDSKGDSFAVIADCMVAGTLRRNQTFTLTVTGDTLVFADAGGQRRFARCK